MKTKILMVSTNCGMNYTKSLETNDSKELKKKLKK